MKLFHKTKFCVWLLLICLLAGCGPGGQTPSGTEESEAKEETTVPIVFPTGDETEPSGAESRPEDETTPPEETTEEPTEPEGPFSWMDPAIVRTEEGLYDVTPAVKSRFPGYNVIDGRAIAPGTLLVLLQKSGGGDGILAIYRLAGEIGGSYTIEKGDMDMISGYLVSWLTEQDGQYIVRLAETGCFAVLDKDLKEVSRRSYTEYVDAEDVSSIIYLPGRDELVYTLWSDHALHVADCAEWKYYTPFEADDEFGSIDSLYLRSDGLVTFDCYIKKTKHMVWDPETREMISQTYTQKTEFIGKEKTALVYSGARRGILWDDEWKTLTYVDEYSDFIMDPDAGIGVSMIPSWRFYNDPNGGCICFSYDLAAGERLGCASFKGTSYGHLAGFAAPNELFSIDAENGLAVFVQDHQNEDLTYALEKDLVLWDIRGGEEEVPQEVAERLSAKERPSHPGMDKDRLVEYLEQKYGIEICLGDECENLFWDVEYDLFEDDEYEFECLLMLEDCLVNYPDGFFTRVAEFYDGPMTFYFCTSLNIVGIDIDEIGIQSEANGRSYVMIEALNMCDRYSGEGDWDMYHTVYHEVGHALERLLNSSRGGEDEDYDPYLDWSIWNSLLPEGFEYRGFENWADNPEYTASGETDEERIYFVDNYATTNELEDRARTIEYAMLDAPPSYMDAPHLQAKMKYYFGILREVLGYGDDVELWWERCLIKDDAQ